MELKNGRFKAVTLLDKFIMEKVNAYIEPQREGNPRGEPIGLSKTKYFASLLMLTKIKQKEIAKMFKVSHGLLRNWNTQEPFKKMVQQNHLDCILFFNEHIQERTRRRQEICEEYFKKPIEEIAQSEPLTPGYEEYSDAGNYSNLLLSMIFKVHDNEMEPIKKKWKQWKPTTHKDWLNKWGIPLEWSNVINALLYFSSNSRRKDLEETEERLERAHLSTIKTIKSILLQPSIEEEEKKVAVALLTQVERFLELKQRKEESRGQKKD